MPYGNFYVGKEGFLYKKSGAVGNRRNFSLALMCNQPADINNKYVSGSGVSGAVSSNNYAIRRKMIRNSGNCVNRNCSISYFYMGVPLPMYKSITVDNIVVNNNTITITGYDSTSSDSSYNYFVFYTSGTISYTVNSTETLQILAVGGGGGGGNRGGLVAAAGSGGGGGGAGGFLENSVSITDTDTITINVGEGGVGCSGSDDSETPPFNGEDTTVSFTTVTSNNITALGGGYGGYNIGSTSSPDGADGASGGGAFGRSDDNDRSGGNPSPGIFQGNPGGNSTTTNLIGGAGGGGVGGNGETTTSGQNGGAGGSGKKPTLSGISSAYPNYYAAGGGGGNGYDGSGGTGGSGGSSIGGDGASYDGTATAATSGAFSTGSGGGGGNGGVNSGGNGGSGIVIIAVPVAITITA